MKKDTNIKSLRGQNEGQFSALLGAPGAGPQTPGPQPPRPVLAPVPPLPTKATAPTGCVPPQPQSSPVLWSPSLPWTYCGRKTTLSFFFLKKEKHV